MILFWPIYQLGHPENYSFIIIFKKPYGSKHPKNVLFNFENRSTDEVSNNLTKRTDNDADL